MRGKINLIHSLILSFALASALNAAEPEKSAMDISQQLENIRSQKKVALVWEDLMRESVQESVYRKVFKEINYQEYIEALRRLESLYEAALKTGQADEERIRALEKTTEKIKLDWYYLEEPIYG